LRGQTHRKNSEHASGMNRS